MNSFQDKGTGETRTYTANFQTYINAGLTISSFAVAIALHEDSDVADTNPSAMLNGAAQKNAAEYRTADGQTIATGAAVMQSIKDGILGALYVVTFTATLSDSQVIEEQATLYISEYVPDE